MKPTLESELEECRVRSEAIFDQLNAGNKSASEYSQLLAEYNSALLRCNKIETELLLAGVSPSKRTKRLESMLRERMKYQ